MGKPETNVKYDDQAYFLLSRMAVKGRTSYKYAGCLFNFVSLNKYSLVQYRHSTAYVIQMSIPEALNSHESEIIKI
jgi:hypothetical protein